MSVACTSCGHAVPLGQFRCGKCGAAQSRDSIEDLDAPSELALESATKEDPGEHLPRESIVPRGTFASDEPVAAVELASNVPAPSSSAVCAGVSGARIVMISGGDPPSAAFAAAS